MQWGGVPVIARASGLLLLATTLGGSPLAAEGIGTLHHSFDVTVARTGPLYFDDEAAIEETTAPAWSSPSLGTLPAGADLTAIHRAWDGRWYFALDTFVDFGAVEAGPEDVIGWNGSAHSLVFDGSAEGIPAGAAIDAIAQAPGMGLILSFDVAIPVGAETADDADIVAWDGSELSIVFVAADYGIPAALDLDALDVDATDDSLYLSFDGSGKLGGVDFDDHDLLHFDLAAWTKLVYPGLAQAGTGAADLDAADYVTEGIFADDFESEDSARWSAAVG